MASITLAVVPSTTPGDSRAALASVCKELGKILGVTVKGAHPASYAALTSELERDRVQFAWMSPALCVLAGQHVKLKPLVSAVRGERTDYCAALFVDAERSLRKIEDLRGKTVAWVDTMSAAGYLYPRLSLAARGIDPSQFFGKELFLGSHAEVVKAVFDGRADLGATYAERPPAKTKLKRAGFIDVAPRRRARVIEWTAQIPNDVIAGHGLIPKPDLRAFGNAVLTLGERPEGKQMLFNAFHADRFTSTPRGALKGLWDLVRLARLHGLLNQL